MRGNRPRVRRIAASEGAKLFGRRFPRFSLLTLVVGIAFVGAATSYLERHTWDDARGRIHWTRQVPAGEEETTRRLSGWLTGHGFRRIESLPDSVQDIDVFAEPYRNFFVGSFEDSPPLYVSFHPNRAGAERGPYADWSNIHFCIAAGSRVRTWESSREFDKLSAFMDEFHRWCDSFEPAPDAPEPDSGLNE